MTPIDQLLQQPGEWLKGEGQEGDVVVSSRVRLARNLTPYKFLTCASPAERKEVEGYARKRLERGDAGAPLLYVPLHEADPLDKQFLLERHLISSEMANGHGERGVAVAPAETLSIMVNEEDHLRIQVLRSGFNLQDAFTSILDVDRKLEHVLPYAFHSQYGFLTCCPTNLGTGLRVSVMMHLPAGVFSKQMDKVLQSLGRLNFTVRGFFGEGTQPVGDLFQVSNQITLGKSEEEIVQEMKDIIPQLIQFERSWRVRLMEDQPNRLQDKIWRAYGILKHARSIASEEALELLSALRLGVHLGMMTDLTVSMLNQMFIFSQPAHLQKTAGRALDPAERDVVRASYIRQKLAGNGKT